MHCETTVNFGDSQLLMRGYPMNKAEKENLEFLPACSPDFNPIERLWRWIKSEYIHNRCWESQAQLRTYLADVLVKLAHRPDELISVMRTEIQRLNTVFEFYETPSPFSAIV
jgi:transposase